MRLLYLGWWLAAAMLVASLVDPPVAAGLGLILVGWGSRGLVETRWGRR